jgi:AcrR family transcriptional regulator
VSTSGAVSEQTDRGSATRQRLIAAAEQLLAQADAREVTLRDITAAAHANVAAVNYHFGSKDSLLRSILERALANHAARYLAALDELSDCGEPCSLDAVVRAHVHASLAAVDDRSGILERIGARLMVPDSRELRELVVATHAEPDARLFEMLSPLLPQLSRDELQFRLTAMHQMIGAVALGAVGEQLVAQGEAPPARDALEAGVVACVVGALSAPAVGGASAGGPQPQPVSLPPLGQAQEAQGCERPHVS